MDDLKALISENIVAIGGILAGFFALIGALSTNWVKYPGMVVGTSKRLVELQNSMLSKLQDAMEVRENDFKREIELMRQEHEAKASQESEALHAEYQRKIDGINARLTEFSEKSAAQEKLIARLQAEVQEWEARSKTWKEEITRWEERYFTLSQQHERLKGEADVMRRLCPVPDQATQD